MSPRLEPVVGRYAPDQLGYAVCDAVIRKHPDASLLVSKECSDPTEGAG